MKLIKMIIACALCVATLGVQTQTRIIAHRGYWKCEGSA